MEVEFRDALNRLIEARRLSQSDIARAADVDRSRVSQWRRGHGFPSPQTLERLADEFGLDLEMLQRSCGYRRQLTGDRTDPEELEFVAILRQVPPEKRSAARDMLLGLAVQPVNRGLANRPSDGAGNRRNGGRPQLDQHSPSADEPEVHGQIPVCLRQVKVLAAQLQDQLFGGLKGLVRVPTPQLAR